MMLLPFTSWIALLAVILPRCALADQLALQQPQQQHVLPFEQPPATAPESPHGDGTSDTSLERDTFIKALVANMTLEELLQQLHLTFGDDLVRAESLSNSISSNLSPIAAAIGHVHDWYPLNISHYNTAQQYNLATSRLKVPLLHFGECLHGVGSFKQSMFPQSLGLAASFDTHLVHRVAHAVATEARSIGIHACLSPVLDVGLDPRWGRMQEAWGEDKLLTAQMGVAFSSGLSKNGSLAAQDAVVPVLKHFAAHGAPAAGRNAAPFMGRGNRQVFQDLVVPFKAAVQLGGAKGIMMAYNEFDDVPAHVNPKLYALLREWGFDGFVIADDTGVNELWSVHRVASSPADAIRQWYEAGGMIQFYDWPFELLLDATQGLVANASLELSTIQAHVEAILGVKWDLGLFEDPFIPHTIDPLQIVKDNEHLTLEAAQKSIVLLENRNATLPLRPAEQNMSKVALIGPFVDVLNYGDYSGQWGENPADRATTLRQAMLAYSHSQDTSASFEVVSSWGTDTWEYNAQHVIPPYLLSSPDGESGGLQATYFAQTNFTEPVVIRQNEVPALDWGIYPPPGLPSTNFSAIWEGRLTSPVDLDTQGWIGVAVGANTTAKLFINGELVTAWGTRLTPASNILGNIESYQFTQVNGTLPPAGSAPFTFRRGETYDVRIEYQAYDLYKKIENVVSLNSQLLLFWNLADSSSTSSGGGTNDSDDTAALAQAVDLAQSADLIVLALGAAWNSDGESADRATLGLSPSQDRLARAIYALGRPVVLVLQGGRPFAIPEYYDRSAAVLSAWFPGQSGGQAIADVLMGRTSPGGKLPVSVPRHVGQIPVNYNYKALGRKIEYLDIAAQPCYPFGYGLSYTDFQVDGFTAVSSLSFATSEKNNDLQSRNADSSGTFASGDTITFSLTVRNDGAVSGSYVAQVYLLLGDRVSSIVQPVKQLVAFQRVYLDAGKEAVIEMGLDVDRYLTIINRWDEWELEKGLYTFALLEHGGDGADTGLNVTLECV